MRLVLPPNMQPLVPLPRLGAPHNLPHLIQLLVGVIRPKPGHQLRHGCVDRYMACVECNFHVRVCGEMQLPGGVVAALEDDDLGVFCWEEVVVALFAAEASGAVG